MLDANRLSTFQERAARVSAVRAQASVASAPVQPPRIVAFAGNAAYPLAILGSFVVGFLTIVLMRWLRFQLSGEIDPNAGLGILDAMLIGGITMSMREVMKFRQASFTAANVLGISFGMLFVHNLVHMMPGLFAWMFSQDWVDVMIHETVFPSVMLGTTIIPIL